MIRCRATQNLFEKHGYCVENENGTTTKCTCVMVKGLVRGIVTGKAVATSKL